MLVELIFKDFKCIILIESVINVVVASYKYKDKVVKKMNAFERSHLILEELEQKEYVKIDELVNLTGTSIATVRRDVKSLHEKRLVERFRGGICLAETFNRTPMHEIDTYLKKNSAQKQRISQYASELVKDGDIIFLDAGSTTYYMIDFLCEKDIFVVTNGIMHLNALISQGISCYALEGKVRLDSRGIFGETATRGLQRHNLNKAFLGASGVHARDGYSTTDSEDGFLKSMAIKRSEESFVLADSSKMGRRKFHTFGNLQDALLLTDSTMDQEFEKNQFLIVR